MDPRLFPVQERIDDLHRVLNSIRIQDWNGPAGDQYRRQVDKLHVLLTQTQTILQQVGPALLAWDGLGVPTPTLEAAGGGHR